MKIKPILLLVFFTIASCVMFAQEDDVNENCLVPTDKKLAKLYQKGTDTKEEYKVRITALKELLEVSPDCAPALWAMAQETYNAARINGNSYEIPKKYYLMLISACPDYHADVYYNMGLIHYSEQDDCGALKYFKEFLKFPTDDDKKLSKKYDKQLVDVKEVIDEAEFYCRFFTEDKVYFQPVLVRNVSSADKDEYLPIISPDNEMLFYTREYKYQAKGDIIGSTIQEFTSSTRQHAQDEFSKGKALPKPFNIGPKYGGATISIDNMEMYICACAKEADYWNCDIFMTKYDVATVDGKKEYVWSDLINLGPNVNGPKTWEAQPSLSADGKTLYFASARPGGYGKIDIYYSKRQPDGLWGPAINLGPEINTAGSDKSPFLHTDSRTLYFVSECSADRLGAGGFDIFYARQDAKTGKWSKPKNIGYPINTEGDEEGLIVSTDGNYGYFSSDKTRGGVGGKDIFYFQLPEAAKPDKVVLMKGKVATENIAELKDTKLEVRFQNGEVTQQEIVIQKTGEFVAVANVGRGNEDVLLEIKQPGKAYESKLVKAESVEKTFIKNEELEIKNVKKGSVHTLNDILFKTNSSEIDPASKIVLQGFAQWLKENPDIKVEIQGHTDDIGSDSDNLALSQDRAFSVMVFITSQGIPASRLKFKGYGETKPKFPNNSDENRKKNRRTDFLIL
jgi:outer membrane protein OmpA-like peptidoglycan-associated protein